MATETKWNAEAKCFQTKLQLQSSKQYGTGTKTDT